MLLYQVAARCASDLQLHQDLLVHMTRSKKITSTVQLDGARLPLSAGGPVRTS